MDTWLGLHRDVSHEMRSIKEIFQSYAEFDSEGRHINGTDKQSNHNYGDAYGMLLSPLTRHEAKFVMEIGVASGECLLAWREVFPNALIVGTDIHPSDKAHGERIEFHLGDMASKRDCERTVRGRRFDLIVEDASHYLCDSLRTLFYLWPFVKPGGLYVIEEFGKGDELDANDLRRNILEMWRNAEIVDTVGLHGDSEPLVVLRKPT